MVYHYISTTTNEDKFWDGNTISAMSKIFDTKITGKIG